MATGKKLINSVDTVVEETLTGLCLTYPQLEFHSSKRVVLVPDWKNRSGKVAVVSGGGSGHEPFAAGFVGSGLLTASIAGSVFAAPPSNHILHALKCVSTNNKAGILVIVPNYTGDCLNFGIAIEKARQAGLTVAELTVGEDCSIPISEQGRAGKRALVGLIFVSKIAGALAERGQSLADVTTSAEIVASNIATYAVGLSGCALPGQTTLYNIPDDEIEIGLGVHAEAGYKRIKLMNAAEVTALMLEQIEKILSLVNGNSVAVIVNNFGATSQLEQGIIVREVVTQLKYKGIKPLRVYAGVLMTCLNSAGVHISILKLPEHYKDTLISCLDEKTNAPSWPGCDYSLPVDIPREPFYEEKRKRTVRVGRALNEAEEALLQKCLKNASTALIEQEAIINDLDSGCGDGDCGTTLRHLAEGILASIDSLSLSYPSSLLSELSNIAEECMGGTSGAIYCLMFTTAATELALAKQDESWMHSWAHAWRGGLEGIMRYSKARLDDRTMLDALDAACKEFEGHLSRPYKEAAVKAAEAARLGCNSTKDMKPKAGRASYVSQAIYLQGVDAGAYAVSIWIDAIAKTLVNFEP
ncbi:triokinase/FMN cyclase [Cephus cinctus]|uniref:Triokinase/FMN cyclase n=1 Tax=Cephus cinctus TaxID=211228 RepID=A0AAJ7RKS7_CEPCN|nr:triokinase/FMN cyclase [Cephus cinctus]XP_024942404.1 triokinase/FMN cyclase [Cephus cinctus]